MQLATYPQLRRSTDTVCNVCNQTNVMCTYMHVYKYVVYSISFSLPRRARVTFRVVSAPDPRAWHRSSRVGCAYLVQLNQTSATRLCPDDLFGACHKCRRQPNYNRQVRVPASRPVYPPVCTLTCISISLHLISRSSSPIANTYLLSHLTRAAPSIALNKV